MGDGSAKIVNLRAARKSAARDAARRQGDANAATFGRTKAQKQAERQDRDRAVRHLDLHHLDQSRVESNARDDGADHDET